MPSWEDSRFVAFDFETTGTLPEYALQSWRVKQGPRVAVVSGLGRED
jgi:DNA polymerase III epsilon subunit-like protein